MKYIDYERYHVVRDDRGLCGFQLMETDFSPTIFEEDRLEHFVSEGKNAGPIGSDFCYV